VLDLKETAPLTVSTFREGRILWLLEPNSAIQKELAGRQKLSGGKYVLYSDITPDSPPFMLDEFEIIPAPMSISAKH
jgi:hypothetical protein